MTQPSRRTFIQFISALAVLVLVSVIFFSRREPEPRWAGTARVDVTPRSPVRLTGFAGRSGPHTGVAQKLWAKALAIGGAGDPPAVWLTLDNCGITRELWLELRTRITRRTGLLPERVVLTISHTHTAPATTGWAPFIQPEHLTAAEVSAIDAYTRELVDHLEAVAVAALAKTVPARLSWGQGSLSFAANRRTAGGPVDHALPVLKVSGEDGKVMALAASYACHCTTCGGGVMEVCGDWAGYAQEALEREEPGALAMIAIGCGADSNPFPRGGDDGGIALARKHGEALAAEVRRVAAAAPLLQLDGNLTAALEKTSLPFDPHFTREDWKQRSLAPDIVGRHARHWLARIDAREDPPVHLEYEVAAWRLGDLTLLFLPGEVVVDYGLRLKREAGAKPLWVNAYSNWVPCYIPSRRILSEGGYEAETSLWYYNRPARLSPETEEIVIRTAQQAATAAGKSP